MTRRSRSVQFREVIATDEHAEDEGPPRLLGTLRNIRGMMDEQPDLAIALNRSFEQIEEEDVLNTLPQLTADGNVVVRSQQHEEQQQKRKPFRNAKKQMKRVMCGMNKPHATSEDDLMMMDPCQQRRVHATRNGLFGSSSSARYVSPSVLTTSETTTTAAPAITDSGHQLTPILKKPSKGKKPKSRMIRSSPVELDSINSNNLLEEKQHPSLQCRETAHHSHRRDSFAAGTVDSSGILVADASYPGETKTDARQQLFLEDPIPYDDDEDAAPPVIYSPRVGQTETKTSPRRRPTMQPATTRTTTASTRSKRFTQPTAHTTTTTNTATAEESSYLVLDWPSIETTPKTATAEESSFLVFEWPSFEAIVRDI